MKKGFTLIEIIITIGLMAILGYLLVANLGNTLTNEQDKQYEEFRATLENAACVYIDLSEASSLKSTCMSNGSCTIPLETVLSKGLISEDDLVNPSSNTRISTDTVVTVSYVDQVKTCTLEELDWTLPEVPSEPVEPDDPDPVVPERGVHYLTSRGCTATGTCTNTSSIFQSDFIKNATRIVFQDTMDEEFSVTGYDASADKDRSIMAYPVLNGDGATYTIYFQTNGTFSLPADASYYFAYFNKLEAIDGLEYVVSDQVTNMYRMFYRCDVLQSLDLSSFDTSHVTNMSEMFRESEGLTTLNLSSFNTSSVTTMKQMFYGCSGLTSLNLSSFETNNVTTMAEMFRDCSSLTTLDLSHFNTSNVTTMQSMFRGCESLSSLNVASFDTSKVTTMHSMFRECSSLTSLNLNHFQTSLVTTMHSMFRDCTSLTSLTIDAFDTSNVTTINSMFYNCSSLTDLNLNGFNTSKVTSMASMFYRCSNLTNLNLSDFETTEVESMYAMFRDVSLLTTLDLSSFDMRNVTTLNFMFYNTSSLANVVYGSLFVKGESATTNYMYTNSIANKPTDSSWDGAF